MRVRLFLLNTKHVPPEAGRVGFALLIRGHAGGRSSGKATLGNQQWAPPTANTAVAPSVKEEDFGMVK